MEKNDEKLDCEKPFWDSLAARTSDDGPVEDRDPAWLRIGGQPLHRLIQRAQGTPFYAYDRKAIDRRIADLRDALPDDVELFYSIKANPFPPLVQHLAGRLNGFDISSGAELSMALNAGVAASDMTFAGPGKNDEELRLAIAVGATISIESANELTRIEQLAQSLDIAPQLILRINPDLVLRGVGMRMGGEPRQFGVDFEACRAVVQRLVQHGENFLGYHIFWGSQCLNADVIVDAQAQSIRAVIDLAEEAGVAPAIVNIGGGFGIPYSPGAPVLDIVKVGQGLEPVMADLRRRWPDARVIVELGRYLVGESGIYVCKVLDRKDSRGKTFLVTDGGMHHHLSASGNLGQILKRNYPILVGNRVNADAEEKVQIAGCLCTPIDMLGQDVALPRAEVGDIIVIQQSGAYGPSASPAGFLSHPAAVELLV